MKNNLRNDLSVIAKLIQKEEKVLDVGCGDGKLLDFLSKTKNVSCRGIELKQNGVNQCVKKGLSVIQGDANFDLSDYPSNAFSTVILSQTIQAMIYPDKVIHNLIRIGKRAIISFPNFGFWKVRKDFLFNGLMPKNKILPFEWFDTPNIHLCSCNDFINFCKNKKININNFILLNENGFEMKSNFLKNLLAYQVVFCISKKIKINMIETTIIPILKDNYTYLIKDKKTGIYGLVDPADAKFLISILEKRKISLDFILITHHHHDHVGGNFELKKEIS